MSPIQSLRARGIIILGMHRSGTSAITRGIQALGAALGGNFLETRFDNPTGYWEDKGIVDLQDRMLADFGMTWEDDRLIPADQWSTPAIRLYAAEARHYLARHFMPHLLWAFKDPRTLRLLPIWHQALARLPVEADFLLVLRNPLSVASSLYARQAMESAIAHRLWLAYLIPHVSTLFATRLTVVDYDLFMDDVTGQLDRLVARLRMPAPPAERETYLRNFLQLDMRHAHFALADLDVAPDVPDVSRSAYLLLRRLAMDELTPTSTDFQAGWSAVEAATLALLATP
jgi:hypothetical protein